MENRLKNYIDDYLYFVTNKDKDGHEALKEENKEKYATMVEAGETLTQIIHDFMDYSDASQAITEARIKAIVDELPDGTKEKIYKKFNEAEDDLFTREGEEIKYD